MIHLIVGDGKGETTASVGLAVRAAGRGWKVLFIQFLKDDNSGEIKILRDIPGITVVHPPVNYGFTFQMTQEQLDTTASEYHKMMNTACESDAGIIILDEVIHALNAGLVSPEDIKQVLNKETEIVLTGRDAPDWLIEKADYVSNVQKIKHPYDKGIIAREGIEF